MRKHPVYALISAISNYHLYDIVRELFEDDTITEVELLFEDIGENVVGNNRFDDFRILEVGESDISVNLVKDAILLCDWNKERYIWGLSNIEFNVGKPFAYDKINHNAAYIYLPYRSITIVYNGSAGILKAEGAIYPNQIYDLTSIYLFMYFECIYFRRKKMMKFFIR